MPKQTQTHLFSLLGIMFQSISDWNRSFSPSDDGHLEIETCVKCEIKWLCDFFVDFGAY